MAPDDRRAALIAATIPLLRQHGLLVTTRQIAEAAGVAEGTIFGVFPDKPSLIRAAVHSALNPDPVVREIGVLDPVAGLRTRLTAAAEILQRRFTENFPLVALAGGSAKAYDDPAEVHRLLMESHRRLVAAVAALIEPDAARLRLQPPAAAQLLVTMMLATIRGGFAGGDPLDVAKLVTLLLDGLLVRPADAAMPEDRAAC